MLWPNGSTVRPTISSPYGPRKVTIAGASSFHLGCDFIGYRTVRAVAAGTVVHVGWAKGWSGGGYMVWVQHDGFLSRSLHLTEGSAAVRVGWHVTEGQALGTMGNTGINGGIHHHLEIVFGGRQIDPVPFIAERLSAPELAATDAKPIIPTTKEDLMGLRIITSPAYRAGSVAVIHNGSTANAVPAGWVGNLIKGGVDHHDYETDDQLQNEVNLVWMLGGLDAKAAAEKTAELLRG